MALAMASGLQHRAHRYRVRSVQRFDVLHQKKGLAALKPIATEDETTRSDGRRHLLGRQRVEEPSQPSVEPLNRTSAFVHRSGLTAA
jgi:hypothetical protein